MFCCLTNIWYFLYKRKYLSKHFFLKRIYITQAFLTIRKPHTSLPPSEENCFLAKQQNARHTATKKAKPLRIWPFCYVD